MKYLPEKNKDQLQQLAENDGNGYRKDNYINTLQKSPKGKGGKKPIKCFELTWTGKNEARSILQQSPCGKLAAIPSESVNWKHTHNLLVEGENLEVLKCLRAEYTGKVKIIYIDPPYNTGNKTFTYKDHFTGDSEQKKSDSDNETPGKLPFESKNAKDEMHARWLSMMLPRLAIARDLLREDGLIFISIDDNELSNLKILMDEIFGNDNYIDIFCWAKSETPANLSRKSKKIVEYILCYQKSKNPGKFKGVRKRTISSNGLLNQSNKENTLIFPPNVVRTNIPDSHLYKGMYGTDKYAVELLEDVTIAGGFFTTPVILKSKFKWTQPKLNAEIQKGTIINMPTDRLSPSYERTEYEAEVPPNLINYKVGVATNETAGNDLKNLFGKKVFDFPKPPSLIKYLLGFSDDPYGIILDFFAGSGSTAQAVLEMNAMDEGNRKFICVQISEPTPENSLARKHGFENIFQITKKRIELVIEKMASADHNSNLSAESRGFRYYKLSNQAS